MKTIMLLIAAVALVGCGQGGTTDQYDTGTSSGRYDGINTNNVAPVETPSATDTNAGRETPSPTP